MLQSTNICANVYQLDELVVFLNANSLPAPIENFSETLLRFRKTNNPNATVILESIGDIEERTDSSGTDRPALVIRLNTEQKSTLMGRKALVERIGTVYLKNVFEEIPALQINFTFEGGS